MAPFPLALPELNPLARYVQGVLGWIGEDASREIHRADAMVAFDAALEAQNDRDADRALEVLREVPAQSFADALKIAARSVSRGDGISLSTSSDDGDRYFPIDSARLRRQLIAALNETVLVPLALALHRFGIVTADDLQGADFSGGTTMPNTRGEIFRPAPQHDVLVYAPRTSPLGWHLRHAWDRWEATYRLDLPRVTMARTAIGEIAIRFDDPVEGGTITITR